MVATRAEGARVGAWWTFMAAHALLVERVGRDLAAATSLPLGSYNVLRLLHEAPGGRLRLSELARAVHLTRSGVTRLANRLERAGLLRREEHAQDRRGFVCRPDGSGAGRVEAGEKGVRPSRRGAFRKPPERRRGRDVECGPESNRDSRNRSRLPMSSLSSIHEARSRHGRAHQTRGAARRLSTADSAAWRTPIEPSAVARKPCASRWRRMTMSSSPCRMRAR